MIIIIFTLIWIAFSSLDGIIQAYYYDLFPSDKGHKNLHSRYMTQRFFLLSVMTYSVAMDYDIVNALILAVGFCFMFSFFHNGFYYVTRHKLNDKLYVKVFFDHSETPTSLIELGAGFRTGMAIMGIIFVIGVLLQISELYN